MPFLRDRLIVALDVDSLEEAGPLVETLAVHVGGFKVGLQLLMAVGAPQAIEFVHKLGGRVFLDGKFNDIPNTVGAATKAVAKHGVRMFTVHASAGMEAMKAAVANKGQSLVIAVTVLTSLDDNESCRIFGVPSKMKVVQLAHDALEAGCDGIVCSPQELGYLQQHEELRRLRMITPGIRPAWAATGDQKRVMTPAEAIKAGATALVIGRPITQPPKEIGTPFDAVRRISDEIATVLC
ncbi:MAG: orotidine-5'-phosphate decarboxylase [bacterium]|nr:orotidine-5'-phosphate decarboxylase [bacterium]